MKVNFKTVLIIESTMPTKTIDDICNMMGCTRERAKNVLDMGVKIGALKKINENEYDMTTSGFAFASSLDTGSTSREAGNWVCIKCNTVNNALNGMNCIKCNYSFEESLHSELFKREKEELKYPKVTERETLLFILGQLTGVSMSIPLPRDMSFSQKFELNGVISKVMSDMIQNIKEKFPSVSDDEFNECLIQLNAVRTMPIVDEALQKIMKSMKR